MHSRVFQLGIKTIQEHDYIRANNFRMESIMDYVVGADNRSEDIEWLLEALGEGVIFNAEEESIVFKSGFKNKYFQTKYQEFKKLCNSITLEDFSGATGCEHIYKLKKAIEDQFGLYIHRGVTQTLDEFVRSMEEGRKYYIGGILDYHW